MTEIEPDDRNEEPRHRLGRPPLPTDQARSERIVTFVTPREFDFLKKQAAHEGTSLSSVVYRTLNNALKKG